MRQYLSDFHFIHEIVLADLSETLDAVMSTSLQIRTALCLWNQIDVAQIDVNGSAAPDLLFFVPGLIDI